MSFFEWLTSIDPTVLTGCCIAIGGLIAFLVIWLFSRLNSKTIVRAKMGVGYDTGSMEKLLADEGNGEKAGSNPEENSK